MKAAILEKTSSIVLKEVEKPTLTGPDEVMIRVKAVGICGSEVHAFHGTHPFRSAPAVLGHEISGIVVEIGAHVDEFAMGDRVIVDPQTSCGECSACRSGNPNLCSRHKVIGTAAWSGGFGEYILAPRSVVVYLPDQLSFAEGAAIEPLSIAVHVAHRARVSAGSSVAVLGSGSIGGLTCGVACAIGAYPVIAVDIRQHCLDTATQHMGATHSLLAPDPEIAHRILEITAGEGVDAVVLCADDVGLLNLALKIVKPQGRIVLVALMTEDALRFAAYDVIKKEAQITGSIMGNMEDVLEAVSLAVSGKVDLKAIITHQLPIEQAQYGMMLASSKEDGAIKVLLTHS